MDVTQWIKESCEHQQATTPEDFIGMTQAYNYALNSFNCTQEWRLLNFNVFKLVWLVKNDELLNFRETPVTFPDGTEGLRWVHVARQLNLLCDAVLDTTLTSEEFYKYFDDIHPFTDGNCQVGAILYNWHRGTLLDPVHPPEFKKR